MNTIFLKPSTLTVAEWVTQLETWLREAQQDAAGGKTRTQAGAGDVNASFLVAIGPERRIGLLLEALSYYAPADYPAATVLPIKRTRPQYS